MAHYFVPYAKAKHQPTILVDSTGLRAALVLAHWRGAATPVALRDDTSAGSVLKALRAPHTPGMEAQAVSANHFDVDGFVGVWSLLNPALALLHEPLLRLVATLGDFRELDWTNPLADDALKLVCWLNAREKELFYPPFGAPALRRNEAEASAEKFAWFLPAFGDILENPELGRAAWEPEYARIRSAIEVMQSSATRLVRYPELGLVVVHTPEPLPYYALFGPTAGFDIVLSCYNDRRYELEYKYTTWIDLESRPTLPRLPLNALAERLTSQEKPPSAWVFDAITDTGPLLRLGGKKLSKAQRYADPDQRPIEISSIDAETMEREVVTFFRKGYASITPRRYWTWAEMKAAEKE
ncbi:hypothetical protein GCM10011375_23830 [Hymenobacter qilianensis]|uniref:Uncharacterized protein n=2 Tax=Hymenobacter qilianensis TaxID=1385715 RepID=A0A7H0GW12_9BACT|nr:DUF6687 family protein [Hymenobacter qilianensis]QNP52478.1 hypothetical protein H9L05_01445 [Hymenobacter qilianensis]GGF68015.1 hypothetical protein GCM10011375_23830 [Hymenobacter qilianensis]